MNIIERTVTFIRKGSAVYTNASIRSKQQFGFVLFDCKLIADTDVQKVYLGRPWRPYARTVYINCELGKHILPEGWNPWKGDAMFPDKEKTTYYAEYGNKGLGASTKEGYRGQISLLKKMQSFTP